MTNVWYVKNTLANCDGKIYFTILQLQRVEMHCKLQEKLHQVTGPSVCSSLDKMDLLSQLVPLLSQFSDNKKLKLDQPDRYQHTTLRVNTTIAAALEKDMQYMV